MSHLSKTLGFLTGCELWVCTNEVLTRLGRHPNSLFRWIRVIFLFADMAELADALDLGSSGRPCRFKSCYPQYIKGCLHQFANSLFCSLSYAVIYALDFGYELVLRNGNNFANLQIKSTGQSQLKLLNRKSEIQQLLS